MVPQEVFGPLGKLYILSFCNFGHNFHYYGRIEIFILPSQGERVKLKSMEN